MTSLPVPDVLAWSGDSENGVGTPYMIMQHVKGVPLQERWPSMDTVQTIRCVDRLSRCIKELAALEFPAYGSLYFSDSSPADTDVVDIGSGFCIGPHCGSDYWPSNAIEPRYYERRAPNRGPWNDMKTYSKGLLDAGYSLLPPSPASDEFGEPIDEHLRLLKLTEQTLDRLIRSKEVQDVSKPTLLHYDFHKRNIYVSDEDPHIVTGIIDWQSTSIEPLFSYAHQTPDFVPMVADVPDPPQEVAVQGIEDEPNRSIDEKAQKKLQTEIDLCQKAYTTVLALLISKLWAAKEMDQTCIRLFRYCNSSWRDGAVALRHELIKLSQQWQELGLPGSCPFQADAIELAKHEKDWEDYETVQKVRSIMFKLVRSNSDGWVPNEHFEEAQQACREAFKMWIQIMTEEGDSSMSEDKACRLWPFNHV